MREPPQDKQIILAQLEKILGSNDFSASDRFRHFLRFVVEETLAGRKNELKAYTIATSVFGRDKNFDPLLDPVVRVEAAKLRSKLEQFYLRRTGSGKDRIKIEIPKGTYVPTFSLIEGDATPDPEANNTSSNEKNTPKDAAPEQTVKQEEAGYSSTKRASIAILPFSNISSSKEINHLLSGMAEELAIALTKFEDIMVISAHAMNIETSAVNDPGTISASLGARFILYGSAQLDNSIIRVRIKLADTATHKTLWAEKFDEPFTATSLFDIIDTTVMHVAAQIGDSFGYIKRTLFKEFPVQRTGDIKAYEAILYYHHWAANLAENRFIKTKNALDKAIQADPNYALAHAMLADIYAAHYQWGYDLFPNDLEKAIKLSRRAVELDPHGQYSQWSKAYCCYLTGDKEQFVYLARLAVSINPSDTNIAAAAGQKLTMAGNWEEGLELMHTAESLNPFLPSWFRTAIYTFHFYNNKLEEALIEAKRITSPDMAGPMLRAAALGALGQKKEANKELNDLFAIMPSFQNNHTKILKRIFFQDSLIKALTKGLKAAGL